jgi:branched-chain amino acid transport system ATP-binding protein
VTHESPVLEVADLSIRFGGVRALSELSFDVKPGELLAVIGPNGAGKTTVFNCLNGIYRPQEGSIRLGGKELIGLRPSRIARLGMARTFQNLALFTQLDVLENLMLGRHHGMRTGLLAASVWFGRARREEIANIRHCREIADFLDLSRYVGRPVGELPYGVQKRVEVGRALAIEPELLLLDEPVAGMSPSETDRMAELILDIQAEFGIAMILVEHDMHLVMDLAERVVALNFGELLAVGTPEVVASDDSVIHSYLGSAEV